MRMSCPLICTSHPVLLPSTALLLLLRSAHYSTHPLEKRGQQIHWPDAHVRVVVVVVVVVVAAAAAAAAVAQK